MQIFGHFLLVLILYPVINFYRKIAEYSLKGLFLMDCVACFKNLSLKADFGCGVVLLFGSLKEVFKVVGFLFLFGTGLRLFQITWHYIVFVCDLRGKSGGLRKGLSLKSDLDVEYCKKIASCESKLLKLSKACDVHASSIETKKITKNSHGIVNSDGGFSDDFDCKKESFLDSEYGESIEFVDDRKDEHECCDEDEEFDVLILRKMVKFERNKARKARFELEKEQVAAATAAEETMAMILRLQNEKSLVEMEANQYRRLAEEKQLHDKEAIQSLQWLLLMHENSLKTVESDEKFENERKGGLYSSLDMVSSP
ncbi:hypothetical protein Leryth_018320 [Lithospermum erythrorhizon]|nr:hypothetical protein Leryth_018320 [Lithospermum erythrorhizon]